MSQHAEWKLVSSLTAMTLLWLSLLYTPSVAAQQPSEDAPVTTLHVDVELIQLPVSVTDERYRAVAGLQAENFEVYEDDVRQRIARLEQQDEPISVGLIFDASGSVTGNIDVCKELVRAFSRFSNPHDEYFLIEFASRPVMLVPFTSRIDQVVNMVGTARAGGRTAFYDAVYMGLAEMGKARNKRKILLLLSDGGENFSTYGEDDIRPFYAQQESTVQIYTIGVFNGVALQYLAEYREGVDNMARLAEMSGGSNFEVVMDGHTDPRAAVPQIASGISRELRTQYVLRYYSSNPNRDGRFRRVRVEVKPPPGSPRLVVRTRPGYIAVAALSR